MKNQNLVAISHKSAQNGGGQKSVHLRYGLKVGLLLAVSYCVANALEIEVTGEKNWIWFGNGSDKPKQTPMEEAKLENGKVALTGNKYYTSTSNFIDSILLNGANQTTTTRANTTNKAVIQTNKSFSIGTLTLRGFTSMAAAGTYDSSNCTDSQCAVFNVTNLIIKDIDNKNGVTLRHISAQNTTITGDGTINIGEKGANGKAENLTNLGNVVVKKDENGTNGVTNGGVTIKSASGAKSKANSISIENGAKLTFDATNGNTGKINVTTLEVKNGGEIAKQNGTNGNLKVQNVVAEAGAKGLDTLGDIFKDGTTNLTITAVKSKTIADFLSSAPTMTTLGTTLTNGTTEGTTIKHNSADNGIFKYGGDFVTTIAKENGNYKAITSTTNLKVEASDRFQASLDNAYLANHI